MSDQLTPAEAELAETLAARMAHEAADQTPTADPARPPWKFHAEISGDADAEPLMERLSQQITAVDPGATMWATSSPFDGPTTDPAPLDLDAIERMAADSHDPVMAHQARQLVARVRQLEADAQNLRRVWCEAMAMLPTARRDGAADALEEAAARIELTDAEEWGEHWMAARERRIAAEVRAGTLTTDSNRTTALVIDAAHLARQREFSQRTFGPGIRLGVIAHIRKELIEVEDDPAELGEWVDVIILGFDGAWRGGHEPQTIIDAIVAKQARNEQRSWPDWRKAPADKAIEHHRTTDATEEQS